MPAFDCSCFVQSWLRMYNIVLLDGCAGRQVPLVLKLCEAAPLPVPGCVHAEMLPWVVPVRAVLATTRNGCVHKLHQAACPQAGLAVHDTCPPDTAAMCTAASSSAKLHLHASSSRHMSQCMPQPVLFLPDVPLMLEGSVCPD